MIDDIDGIINGGISRKAIESAIKKFNYDFDKTVDYLLDRKIQKATSAPAGPKPVPAKQSAKQPDKQPVKQQTKQPAQKLPTGVSHKTATTRKSNVKDTGIVDEPLIVERKQSRKMSKEVMLELPLDKTTWNKLYPLIDYAS